MSQFEQRIVLAFIVLCLLFLLALFAPQAVGRDMTGLSAQLSQEQRDWVRSLKDKKGVSCCDNFDGTAIDAWEIRGTNYWIKLNGEWIEVPETAVIAGPNRVGVARAWIGAVNGKTIVRCFIAGDLT